MKRKGKIKGFCIYSTHTEIDSIPAYAQRNPTRFQEPYTLFRGGAERPVSGTGVKLTPFKRNQLLLGIFDH
ncbi:hypothetical protein OUZ56_007668 [Daphnia magna]|uniref:Uncharacterized protein n=1 Tax=Daphnia magna TaxID=35525 RepID=A0ABR0AAN0_9CRUS|nr:hypothetical protein OUZ56_007668 [Daphnia magna]